MENWLQRLKNAYKVLTGHIPPEIASLSDKQVVAIRGIIAGTHHAKRYAPKKATIREIQTVEIGNFPEVEG